MNNQNNNNFDSSFSNSKKTPPRDMLTLSSSVPKKASISPSKQSNNVSGKFIISNDELNSINTTVVNSNNNSIINNNQPQIKPQQQSQPPIQQAPQQTVQQSSGKFISEPVEKKSSVKNININTNTNSIFNAQNNQNMSLNSNNKTYPNYNNQQMNQPMNQQISGQDKMNMLMGNNTNNNINNNPQMSVDDLMKESYTPLVELEHKTKRENKIFFGILIGSVVVFIITICIAFFATGTKISFFGGEAYYENKEVNKTEEDQTYVYTGNKYTNVDVENKEQAVDLIKKDSNNQKDRCSQNVKGYEKTKQLEEKMEQDYGITAVNFCEMDYNYLVKLEKQIKKVYDEFPILKGHVTNLSISNELNDAIAAHNEAEEFSTTKSLISEKYNVQKTRIYLNARYFLNIPYLKNVAADSASPENGHFPKNASEYSVVIHEFGHALSSLAVLYNTEGIDSYMLKNRKNVTAWGRAVKDYNVGLLSKTMLDEAMAHYNANKSNKKKYYDLEKFRAAISRYAAETDDNGEPVYDEAIAEAFHDYFVNGKKAKAVSLEVVKVLKKYLSK